VTDRVRARSAVPRPGPAGVRPRRREAASWPARGAPGAERALQPCTAAPGGLRP